MGTVHTMQCMCIDCAIPLAFYMTKVNTADVLYCTVLSPLLWCARGDFYGYMTNWGKTKLHTAEFLSIAEAAGEIRKWLRNDNVTRLFIATNARKHELEIYKALVQGAAQYSTVQYCILRTVLDCHFWACMHALHHVWMGREMR